MKKDTDKQAAVGRYIWAAVFLAVLATLPSCVYDQYPYYNPQDDPTVAVKLNIRTRAANNDGQTFEIGSAWENYIDIAGGDCRIYFFTNDRDDASATSDDERNTLIAEFEPRDISSIDGTNFTQYTLLGNVGNDIADYGDFKVVVLANWGHYPTVTAGVTTIDSLVEGDNSTFLAETFLTASGIDSNHLIPFFGVREYSGVEWKKGKRTALSGEITLLRAIAKVEVVLSEDSAIEGFDSVSIVRHNISGYCAPRGVYVRSDYDNNYIWEQSFTDELHLVGGQNSATGDRVPFNRQLGTERDTWTVYIPEYDNTSGRDFSHIQVNFDGADYEIYFANYTNGATSSTADYDIFRNCLYRFYVTVYINEEEVTLTIRVQVDNWEACFDNEYVFDVESSFLNLETGNVKLENKRI